MGLADVLFVLILLPLCYAIGTFYWKLGKLLRRECKKAALAVIASYRDMGYDNRRAVARQENHQC